MGITCNLQQRLMYHLKDTADTKKTRWIHTLKEEGITPIITKLEESEDIYKIINLEIEYIKKYKETLDLANTTIGGEYYAIDTPIDCYDLQGNYIETFSSMVEALPGIKHYSGISAVCNHKRNYAYGKIWRYQGEPVTKEDLEKVKKSLNKAKYKEVLIIDLEGNILDRFPSLTKAGQSKKWGSISNLRCAMKGHNAHGNSFLAKNHFICSSMEDFYEKRKKYEDFLKSKIVLQYTLDDEFIAEYPSVMEASRVLNKSWASIFRCCKGQQQEAHGFKWKLKF